MSYELKLGNCLDVMKTIEDNTIDAVITDPPYGIGFMNKEWDHGVPGKVFWDEVIRITKPGAYLLAFGGTRKFHRLMVEIEDAGWELRDTIMYVFGSGMNKGMDVSKAIDKASRGCPQGTADPLSPNHGKYKPIGSVGAGASQYLKRETQNCLSGGELKNRCQKCNKPFFSSNPCVCPKNIPITDLAKQWEGWGTTLKPAYEPIIVARKPLVGTVVENLIQYKTGAINIDACRVEPGTYVSGGGNNFDAWRSGENREDRPSIHEKSTEGHNKGRFPSNFIIDGSEEVLELFPNTKSGKLSPHHKRNVPRLGNGGVYCDDEGTQSPREWAGDSGSAARFFYCAKASKKERGEGNNHPTVKPLALMKYLCKLVTSPNGIILDPFCGSGSTGVAAIELGFNFLGIELEEPYVKIAKSRLEKCNLL